MINKKRGQEPIDFIGMLKLTDDFFGKPFILQNWQREVIYEIYGRVNEKGYRQYNYAYLEIPKKMLKQL